MTKRRALPAVAWALCLASSAAWSAGLVSSPKALQPSAPEPLAAITAAIDPAPLAAAPALAADDAIAAVAAPLPVVGAPERASASQTGGPAAQDAGAVVFDGERFLSSYSEPALPTSHDHKSYVHPNELDPNYALPILQRARPGLYVSIGTERGFISAALAHSTHLLLVDHDADVAAYNRANVALLRLAKDREDYVRLRRASRAEIETHEGYTRLDAQDRAALGADLDVFAKNQPGNPLYADGLFRDSNYLKDDALFARVKALADGGRIKVARLDLRDRDAVAGLAGAVERSGVPLSVVDVSNSWLEHYAGSADVASLTGAFSRSAHPDSILMVTRHRPGGWFYWGFRPYRRGANGLETENVQRLIKRLSNYTPDRLNTIEFPRWPRRLLNLTMSVVR